MENEKLKDVIDALEIKLMHLKNDYLLTKQEHEVSTEKYLEVLYELKESEEKYRKLVEINPNVIYQIDNKGIITFISSRINEIIGYKSDELIGKNISEIIYKDDLDKIKLVNERRTGDRATRRLELRLTGKDGIKHIETRCVGINATGVYGNGYMGDGKIESRGKTRKLIGTHGTITDITERKKQEGREKIRFELYKLKAEGATPEKMREYIASRGINIKGKKIVKKNSFTGELEDIIRGQQEKIKFEARRKKAEEALRESERFLDDVFESIQDGISVLDTDLTVCRVNKIIEQWYAENLPLEGKKCYVCYHKSDKVCDPCPTVRCIQSGKTEMEIVPGLPGSPIEYIELFSFPIKDQGSGKVKGVVEYARDITERKKAEGALRESEERFRIIFESARDSIFIKDCRLRYTMVNPTMEKLFGFPTSELIGRTDEDLFGKEAVAHIRDMDSRVLNGEIIEEEDTKPVKGIPLTFHVVKVPICDSSGKIIGLCGIARDITEHKRLEEQLQIRQRMDSLGTLAGGIAHDFNNILVGIMGYINMLNLEPDGFTGEQKEYLENAEKGCDRAAEVIKQFQAFTRGTVSERTSVDIYETANEVFNVLRETTDRLIEKKIGLKPGEFYVTANPSEFNQVFLNLGTNAVQAIEERGVKQGDYVRITADEHRSERFDSTGLPEGEYIHILFEDNGKGMSDEVRRKAFDPLFTTRDKSRKRGQGLGLAMVYNIVTRTHNGYIDMESEEGKGTKIHIYLPKAQPEKRAGVKEVIGIIGGNETILVVDDEKTILSLTRTLLKKYGYNVKTAIDGERAMEIYNEYKYSIDAVILDLTMPRISGKMVFERMLEINPDVKVIISTGHSDEDAREGILSKAKGYVKKPYKLANLTQTVRTVLDL